MRKLPVLAFVLFSISSIFYSQQVFSQLINLEVQPNVYEANSIRPSIGKKRTYWESNQLVGRFARWFNSRQLSKKFIKAVESKDYKSANSILDRATFHPGKKDRQGGRSPFTSLMGGPSNTLSNASAPNFHSVQVDIRNHPNYSEVEHNQRDSSGQTPLVAAIAALNQAGNAPENHCSMVESYIDDNLTDLNLTDPAHAGDLLAYLITFGADGSASKQKQQLACKLVGIYTDSIDPNNIAYLNYSTDQKASLDEESSDSESPDTTSSVLAANKSIYSEEEIYQMPHAEIFAQQSAYPQINHKYHEFAANPQRGLYGHRVVDYSAGQEAVQVLDTYLSLAIKNRQWEVVKCLMDTPHATLLLKSPYFVPVKNSYGDKVYFRREMPLASMLYPGVEGKSESEENKKAREEALNKMLTLYSAEELEELNQILVNDGNLTLTQRVAASGNISLLSKIFAKKGINHSALFTPIVSTQPQDEDAPKMKNGHAHLDGLSAYELLLARLEPGRKLKSEDLIEVVKFLEEHLPKGEEARNLLAHKVGTTNKKVLRFITENILSTKDNPALEKAQIELLRKLIANATTYPKDEKAPKRDFVRETLADDFTGKSGHHLLTDIFRSGGSPTELFRLFLEHYPTSANLRHAAGRETNFIQKMFMTEDMTHWQKEMIDEIVGRGHSSSLFRSYMGTAPITILAKYPADETHQVSVSSAIQRLVDDKPLEWRQKFFTSMQKDAQAHEKRKDPLLVTLINGSRFVEAVELIRAGYSPYEMSEKEESTLEILFKRLANEDGWRQRELMNNVIVGTSKEQLQEIDFKRKSRGEKPLLQEVIEKGTSLFWLQELLVEKMSGKTLASYPYLVQALKNSPTLAKMIMKKIAEDKDGPGAKYFLTTNALSKKSPLEEVIEIKKRSSSEFFAMLEHINAIPEEERKQIYNNLIGACHQRNTQQPLLKLLMDKENRTDEVIALVNNGYPIDGNILGQKIENVGDERSPLLFAPLKLVSLSETPENQRPSYREVFKVMMNTFTPERRREVLINGIGNYGQPKAFFPSFIANEPRQEIVDEMIESMGNEESKKKETFLAIDTMQATDPNLDSVIQMLIKSKRYNDALHLLEKHNYPFEDSDKLFPHRSTTLNLCLRAGEGCRKLALKIVNLATDKYLEKHSLDLQALLLAVDKEDQQTLLSMMRKKPDIAKYCYREKDGVSALETMCVKIENYKPEDIARIREIFTLLLDHSSDQDKTNALARVTEEKFLKAHLDLALEAIEKRPGEDKAIDIPTMNRIIASREVGKGDSKVAELFKNKERLPDDAIRTSTLVSDVIQKQLPGEFQALVERKFVTHDHLPLLLEQKNYDLYGAKIAELFDAERDNLNDEQLMQLLERNHSPKLKLAVNKKLILDANKQNLLTARDNLIKLFDGKVDVSIMGVKKPNSFSLKEIQENCAEPVLDCVLNFLAMENVELFHEDTKSENLLHALANSGLETLLGFDVSSQLRLMEILHAKDPQSFNKTNIDAKTPVRVALEKYLDLLAQEDKKSTPEFINARRKFFKMVLLAGISSDEFSSVATDGKNLQDLISDLDNVISNETKQLEEQIADIKEDMKEKPAKPVPVPVYAGLFVVMPNQKSPTAEEKVRYMEQLKKLQELKAKLAVKAKELQRIKDQETVASVEKKEE